MYLAFHLSFEKVSEDTALQLAEQYLRLMRWEKVDPYLVLLDCARFYGIFVPSGGAHWEFVHKTLYDYLAAKYWVETGDFSPAKVRTWSSRAAYAASIIPDATRSILSILRKGNLGLINDLLLNDPYFDYETVGQELTKVLATDTEAKLEISEQHCYLEGMQSDIISNASEKLLYVIAESAFTLPKRTGDAVLVQAMFEMERRKGVLPADLYARIVMRFGEDGIYFVSSQRKFRLSKLKPAPGASLPDA